MYKHALDFWPWLIKTIQRWFEVSNSILFVQLTIGFNKSSCLKNIYKFDFKMKNKNIFHKIIKLGLVASSAK